MLHHNSEHIYGWHFYQHEKINKYLKKNTSFDPADAFQIFLAIVVIHLISLTVKLFNKKHYYIIIYYILSHIPSMRKYDHVINGM